VREVHAFLESTHAIEKILFVCFDRHTRDCYDRVLSEG